MNENLDHSRDGSSDPGSRAPAPPVVSAPANVARRRRFLTGGAVAGATVMTLASRSALATCTISGMISGFGSAAHREKPGAESCGSTPACWKQAPTASWTSAGFNKTSSSITTSLLPSTQNFSDTHGTASAAFSTTGTPTFSNILNNTSGGVSLVFTEKNGGGTVTATTTITNAFLQEYVAAFLNNGLFDASPNDFFGHNQAAIIAVLAAIQTAGVNASSTGTPQQTANARALAATNAIASNQSLLTGWNAQGGPTC
jgi:hypothetical protein